MIVGEIGLNHLGNRSYLDYYINSSNSLDAITIQILTDKFFKDSKFSDFKLTDETIQEFIQSAYTKSLKVGLVVDNADLIKKFHCDQVSFYKILSKDINNKNILKAAIESSAEEIFLSTGVTDFSELDKIIPNLVKSDGRIKLIHTQLSNEIEDVNLKAIKEMSQRYGIPVAYGHHCSNENVIFASLGFNPDSLFFYLKGEDELNFPDKFHAISIKRVDELVKNINLIKKSIGNGFKLNLGNKLRENLIHD